MGRVEGKVAIVTGSTYGIGEAIARILAREGAVSIITGRSQEEGKKVVEAITSAGSRASTTHWT
jgi:NAD(P)-dependent dehydrogenase (short-subunit alcohol dehydrogenase family)